MEALEKSAEDPALVLEAKRYLQGILKSVARTAQEKRKKALHSAQAEPQIRLNSPSVGGVSHATFIDLTESAGS